LQDNGELVTTVVDIDGVLVSPTDAAIAFLRDRERFRTASEISHEKFRWLENIARLSDSLTIWTSRFPGNQIIDPILDRHGISYFPWLTNNSVNNLQGYLENRTKKRPSIIRGKSADPHINGRYLYNHAMQTPNLRLVYVGSSRHDRQATEAMLNLQKMLSNGPRYPSVLFDTCHLFL